jgi:probable HAF family extracellular repeat protein
VITDLGTFGGTYSTASGINSAGQVVGYALTASGDAHGFLYDGAAMRDLNSMFAGGSICTNLISADGINDAGQITGSGYTASGAYHAYLLTPGLVLTQPSASGGTFRVLVAGAPGQKFIVEASVDLINWTNLGTNTLVYNTFPWTDSGSPNYANRFYRAMAVP